MENRSTVSIPNDYGRASPAGTSVNALDVVSWLLVIIRVIYVDIEKFTSNYILFGTVM